MKKTFIIILILFIPTFILNSKESIIIKKFNTEIEIINYEDIIYYNTFDILISDSSSEYFWNLEYIIPKNRDINNDKNIYKIESIAPHTDHLIKVEEKENIYEILLEGNKSNFKNKDKIKFVYEISNNKETKDLDLVIFQNQTYKIDILEFKVVLPEEYINKKITFSIDNKHYYEVLNELDYKINNNIIEGTYSTKNELNNLYLKISNVKKQKIDIRKVIVYASAFSVFLVVLATINIKKHKNKI